MLKDIIRKGFSGANILRIAIFLFFTWLIMECFFEITEMQYHYYKNINTSLEHIYNKGLNSDDKNYVRFDNYNGKIKQNTTTEQELLRDMNKKTRFRLRDMRQGYRVIFH